MPGFNTERPSPIGLRISEDRRRKVLAHFRSVLWPQNWWPKMQRTMKTVIDPVAVIHRREVTTPRFHVVLVCYPTPGVPTQQ